MTAEQDQAWVAMVAAQCAFLRAHGWKTDGSGLWADPRRPSLYEWDLDHAVMEQNQRHVRGET